MLRQAGAEDGWQRLGARPAPGTGVTGSRAEALLTCRQVKRQEVWVFGCFFFLFS